MKTYKHMRWCRWWLVITIMLLLPAVPTAAQTGTDHKRIASVLLTTPERCGEPCIWTFQPGVAKLDDFRQFTISLFDTMEERPPWVYQRGSYADGVGLFSWAYGGGDNPNPVVDYVYVRVRPSVAQAAGIDLTHFTPAAMISALGNPDDAYLMYSRANLVRWENPIDLYRLVLVYRARFAVYVIYGKLREAQVCLIPDTAETLTLYRFAPESIFTQQFRQLILGDDHAFTSIAVTTNQTVADFTRMAQHPDIDCLTLT